MLQRQRDVPKSDWFQIPAPSFPEPPTLYSHQKLSKAQLVDKPITNGGYTVTDHIIFKKTKISHMAGVPEEVSPPPPPPPTKKHFWFILNQGRNS